MTEPASRDDALDRLLPVVHEELHALASRYLASERPGHTLQTTALVNEAYLRLVDQRAVCEADRNHFLALAAISIRRILTNYARSRNAARRGGGVRRVPLEGVEVAAFEAPEQLLAIDDALDRLASFDARKARVVELRFFAGLEVAATAEVIGVSKATVEREWTLARAWLQRELGEESGRGE